MRERSSGAWLKQNKMESKCFTCISVYAYVWYLHVHVYLAGAVERTRETKKDYQEVRREGRG